MNQYPFPKPPPATPLPLEDWLDLTDRAEVGREPFFRGRNAEYGVFRRAAKSLGRGHVGGGTMIFQGAPGAGKTALMGECMEAVLLHSTPQDPWVAVSIEPDTLQSAANVVMILIEEANRERERLAEQFPGQVSRGSQKLKDLGHKLISELSQRDYTVSAGGLGMTMHGKSENASNPETILAERVFRDAAPLLKDIHMVVFVDEAQNIPVTQSTKAVLKCLHKNPKDIPLVAAFFGLSDTRSVLERGGLSRPPRDRVVTLDTLSNEDTTNAIQSIFDAYGFRGSSQTTWVEALADLSQGWPQHINSVSVAAIRILCSHGGSLDESLLQQAIESGRKFKDHYYAFRLEACTQDLSLYKKIALVENEMADRTLSRTRLRSLTAPLLLEATTFDEFLTNALHAGVLMETLQPPKYYRIPIPSFGDYLRALPED
ncbi:MAG: hypothetical protein OXF20_02040 [Gammaproteobacteria bacterium]|nr:hypothetical protein [Gammaproteobacteria bacterium]